MSLRKKIVYTIFALCFICVMSIAGLLMAAVLLSSKLPDVSQTMSDHPVAPLTIYTKDGVLIAQFGPRQQDIIPFERIPTHIKQAVLAAEDDRFYEHGAVDWLGVLRALLGNLMGRHLQGASTITMQVSRDLFLSNERTYKRKLIETLIAYKLESYFTKDQILAFYINHVYLGKNAFGFASASQTYFGKTLDQLSIAESAMLAGLPKAPSNYNPLHSMDKAKSRQHYVLQRMHLLGYITDEAYQHALKEPITLWQPDIQKINAGYVAEMVRQYILAQYGPNAYMQGLTVITTIDSHLQNYATKALRTGLMNYIKRNNLATPITHVDVSNKPITDTNYLNHLLDQYPEVAPLRVGIILSISPTHTSVYLHNQVVSLPRTSFLSQANHMREGDIFYFRPSALHRWEISGIPPVEGALVSADPRTGAIQALCGGFSFRLNQFNHTTQAWRQPGSSIKPFVYIAALEKGYTPSSILDDAPFMIDPKLTGNRLWEPKNFDNIFHGPTTLRMGLSESLNVLSVRLLMSIGIPAAQHMLRLFGFDLTHQPPFLTLVLGAGTATPWQMLQGYLMIANGGYPIAPYLIDRILDHQQHIIESHHIHHAAQAVISARSAIEIDDMLKSVINEGTGRGALILNRQDIAGKTGTTNDDVDTWFCGYHPHLATVVWVGYDSAKSLGKHETGAISALPIWTQYMGSALKDVPYTSYPILPIAPTQTTQETASKPNPTSYQPTPTPDTMDPFSSL